MCRHNAQVLWILPTLSSSLKSLWMPSLLHNTCMLPVLSTLADHWRDVTFLGCFVINSEMRTAWFIASCLEELGAFTCCWIAVGKHGYVMQLCSFLLVTLKEIFGEVYTLGQRLLLLSSWYFLRSLKWVCRLVIVLLLCWVFFFFSFSSVQH